MTTFDVTAHYSLSRPSAAERRRQRPVAAVDAARRAQPVPRLPLHARASCPTSRCARASPTRASATSRPSASTSRPTRRASRSQHFVNRWRLEKKDPAAALSEPKQPIVFWLDRNIPDEVPRHDPRRHPRVEQGVRAHRLQGRDPRRGAARRRRLRHRATCATPRSAGMTTARTSSARSARAVVDPRTGEILDADIGIDANNVRVVAQPHGRARSARSRRQRRAPADVAFGDRHAHCAYDDDRDRRGGLRAVAARGARRARRRTAPTPSAFVAANLKDVMMHEVGHTLGLRHNFRASTIYTEAQLADPEFTQAHGIAGSVMEYNAVEHRARGRAAGRVPDDHARPVRLLGDRVRLPRARARRGGRGARARSRAAAASRELAYATDEDASFHQPLDPRDQPARPRRRSARLRAERRIALVARAVGAHRRRARSRTASSYVAAAPQLLARAVRGPGRARIYAAKYIGGLTTLRDRAGPRPRCR